MHDLYLCLRSLVGVSLSLMTRQLAYKTLRCLSAVRLGMITRQAIEAHPDQVLGHELGRPGGQSSALVMTTPRLVVALRIRRPRESGWVHDHGGKTAARCLMTMR